MLAHTMFCARLLSGIFFLHLLLKQYDNKDMLRRFLKITIALIVFSSAVFCEDWYVCLGSFKKQELAQRRMDLFVDSDISAFISEAKSKDGDTLYRVLYFKPFDSYASAMTKRAELSRHSVIKKFGIDDLWCCKSDGPLLRTVEIVKEIPVEVEKEVIKEVPVEVIKEVPVEKEVIKEVVKEVPVEVEKEVIKEVPVEVIKEVPVEIEKEVIKEVPVEVVKEVIKEVPVEVIKEVPVEKEVVKEVIKEVPVEKEVEVVKEVPVEVVKEVIKEVPVEVIKEVPVEKEVIKEVIKEVPVEKEVEVVKEVPVEVVKEVIKEVPVEVIKEVPVEVIKEVPVEKEVIKEVIKEVPVEVIKEVIKEVPVEVIKEVPVEKDSASGTPDGASGLVAGDAGTGADGADGSGSDSGTDAAFDKGEGSDGKDTDSAGKDSTGAESDGKEGAAETGGDSASGTPDGASGLVAGDAGTGADGADGSGSDSGTDAAFDKGEGSDGKDTDSAGKDSTGAESDGKEGAAETGGDSASGTPDGASGLVAGDAGTGADGVDGSGSDSGTEAESVPAKVIDYDKRTIIVRDSDSGEGVPGAVVTLSNGRKFVTDESGKVVLPENVEDGTYEVTISKDGEYVSTTAEMTIKDDEIVSSSRISIPKAVDYERIKIVLDWTSNSIDLDAHIKCGWRHVYYSNRKSKNMRLDHDERHGNGVETITIEGIDASSVYEYYVYDFTNQEKTKTTALSNVKAHVSVFVNNTFKTEFTITPNQPGTKWHVFNVVNGNDLEVKNTVSY